FGPETVLVDEVVVKTALRREVRQEPRGQGVQQCRLARAVGADDDRRLLVRERQLGAIGLDECRCQQVADRGEFLGDAQFRNHWGLSKSCPFRCSQGLLEGWLQEKPSHKGSVEWDSSLQEMSASTRST